MADKLLNRFENIIVYSPHYDDAFLSLGGILFKLKGNIKITIVILFGRSSYLNKEVLPYNKSAIVSQIRLQEENINVNRICGKLIVFNNNESFLRGYKMKREGEIRYPSQLIESDYEFREKLEKQVIKILKSDKLKTLHLFPMGIGNHVDHVLVNMIGKKLQHDYYISYYEDQPYVSKHIINYNFFDDYFEEVTPVRVENKIKSILNYKSQYAYEWIGDILRYMSSINGYENLFVERIWTDKNSRFFRY